MIIGICGFKGTGKSTIAKYLVENYGFKSINFKDGLIEEMKSRFPNTLSELDSLVNDFDGIDVLFQRKDSVTRAFLQEYGTEVRRADDPDYWVKIWQKKVNEVGGNIVVDDVRFFNELAAVGDSGGVLIRVTRPDIVTGGEHRSETEHMKFIEDFTIEGTLGSHESLFKQVDAIIETIKSNHD